MRALLPMGALLAAGVSTAATAAPLQPIADTVRGVALAQVLGTAELLGEWKMADGSGNVRLVQAMTRNGGECEDGGGDTADACPRFTLFVVLNGETSGPVDFAVYALPEALGWRLPETFEPAPKAQTSVVPLEACEMAKTAKGYGWRGTSYRLTVGERLVGGKGPNFLFDVSLDKLPGERPDCAAR